MSTWRSQLTNGVLNVALAVGGLSVIVLLYAFVTRTVFTDPAPNRPASDSSKLVGEIIQVEVRNGAGVDNLATRTTEYLRDKGFDVVETGNYSSFDQEKSMVIDRVGNLEAARRVAEVLGIPTNRVRQEIRPQYYLDASVIIGHDHKQLRPFQETQ